MFAVAGEKLNAYDVVRKHQQTVPVDVSKIAVDLGITVWESRRLPDGISGKLFIDPHNGGPSGFSILVNASDAFTRKRFTIAHELAHFILHLKDVDGGVQDDAFYRSRLSDKQEREANRLAADILMPIDAIQQMIRAGVRDVSQLAARFAVSTQAMAIRLDLPVV
jgi:hypothetical protein